MTSPENALDVNMLALHARVVALEIAAGNVGEVLVQTQAGVIAALGGFAEALIKRGVAPDGLIADLRYVSGEMMKSELGPAGQKTIDLLIALIGQKAGKSISRIRRRSSACSLALTRFDRLELTVMRRLPRSQETMPRGNREAQILQRPLPPLSRRGSMSEDQLCR